MHFVPWWVAPPAIVAEALTPVPEPLSTALRAGPEAPPASVVSSIARSLKPAEDMAPPPPWLLPAQRESFRRALAAVRRYRGALLADPVGSGKTYVALALAAELNRGNPTACLVPATLLTQWRATAAALEVPVVLCSHEQASRGRLPRGTHGLVIVDESHHFRNRRTKRYAHLAQWMVSRPALLISANPVVNRLAELGAQLLLAIRDDVLAIDGVPSLRSMLAGNRAPAALGQLVLEHDGAASARPRKTASLSAPTPEECDALDASAELIGRLSLSHSSSISALIRGVLLWAAASSPAALTGSLQRYRRLLLHAQDALRAGCVPDRRELRRFTGQLGDQLVWWELLSDGGGTSDLELADLTVLDEILPVATAAMDDHDAKLGRLSAILRQGQPTLVFSGSRDTVRYIQRRLTDLRLAWCTGSKAGIGHCRLPRNTVLEWFRENGSVPYRPSHLIVTDVAAEGLDLQYATRVVHYDLPWTPMRLEQREGRSVRLGSRHAEVEVFRFNPPASFERLLGIEATLARKAKLPETVGLGPGGRGIWRWRSDLAEELGLPNAVAGVAQIGSAHRGVLAGIGLYRSGNPPTRLSAVVGWLDPNGAWTEEPGVITDRLRAAVRGKGRSLEQLELRRYLDLLTPLVRQRLALTRGGRWLSADPSPAGRAIAARLSALIRHAARLRQELRLSELERGLRFVAGGHTAGEELLLDRLVETADRQLVTALRGTVPHPEWSGIEARLTGLIVFGP